MMRYRRLVVSAVEYHGLYHRWPYSYPIILTSVVCISDVSAYLLSSSKFPSFKIGETSAIFQQQGKIPVANEAFMGNHLTVLKL